MAQEYGYIYKITNDVNDKVYIGETYRNIETRFSEHCFDKRSTSAIHKAIEKIGYQHFKVEEIEQVPLAEIYEREAYWVNFYDSYNTGYNSTKDGHGAQDFLACGKSYNQIRIVEPNIYFLNLDTAAREISNLTLWSFDFVKRKLLKAIRDKELFLDFHVERVEDAFELVSSVDDRENWIKNLNIKFSGKHIYCKELDKDFETMGQAAKYIYDAGLYHGQSKIPIPTLISSISQNLKGKNNGVKTKEGFLTFEEMPGVGTKAPGGKNPFQKTKVKCVELNKTFDSIAEAADFMVKNEYWKNIKVKTAKCRISDIIRGVFPNYKNYSFEKIET